MLIHKLFFVIDDFIR